MIEKSIISNIKVKIENAESILVLAAKPVDHDCIGTALAIRYWLLQMGKKKVDAGIFQPIPEMHRSLPGMNDFKSLNYNATNLDNYDLIILEDGNDWSRFFQLFTKDVLNIIDKEKFIHIDHHPEGEVSKKISTQSLHEQASCTAEVFYKNIFPEFDVPLDTTLAEYLAIALLGDTQVFNVLVFDSTFSFANDLLNAGINYYKVVDLVSKYPKESIDLMSFLSTKTHFHKDLKTTIVVINYALDEEIKMKFGENWRQNRTDMAYKDLFQRRVQSFDYGLIFEVLETGVGVKASWRSIDNVAKVAIYEVLKNIGFEGGGHFGAGGARSTTVSIDEVEDLFVEEMKNQLSISNIQ